MLQHCEMSRISPCCQIDKQEGSRMKLFYTLKRKVLAVCLAGMILMALCVGGISLWTISHLTYDYEI